MHHFLPGRQLAILSLNLLKFIKQVIKEKGRELFGGDVPDSINPPLGCSFHPRCPDAKDICGREELELKNYSKNENEHLTACFLRESLFR